MFEMVLAHKALNVVTPLRVNYLNINNNLSVVLIYILSNYYWGEGEEFRI